MGKTILGRKPTEDEDKRWKAESLDWQRFEILINICLEHYISIDTKPNLENLCRGIVKIACEFNGEALGRVPNKGKHRLLGEVIEKAVKHDSIRSTKKTNKNLMNNKQIFKSLVKELVDMAHANGHKLINESAYQFIGTLLKKYGVSDNNGGAYTGSGIRKWCKE